MLLLLHPPEARRNPRMLRRLPPAALLNPVNVAPADMEALSSWPGVVTPAYRDAVYTRLAPELDAVVRDLQNGGLWLDPNRRPYPYQLAGIAFALARQGRAMILDPMGLGKTLQGIGFLAADPAAHLPALVVGPPASGPSWKNDIQGVPASGGRPEKKGWLVTGRNGVTVKTGIPGPQETDAGMVVRVITYSQIGNLRNRFSQGLPYRTVIFDEAHNIRDLTNSTTQDAFQLSRDIPNVLVLTGTPIINAPSEMYALTLLVRPQNEVISPQASDDTNRGQSSQFLMATVASVATNAQLRKMTTTDWRTYDPFTPQISGAFNAAVRRVAARRSRESVTIAPGAGISAPGQPPPPRKVRIARFVSRPRNVSPASYWADVDNELQRLTLILQQSPPPGSRGSGSKQSSATDFISRANNYQQWLGQLTNNVERLGARCDDSSLTEPIRVQAESNLRRSVLKGNIPVPEHIRAGMGEAVLPEALNIYRQRATRTDATPRPVIFFAKNVAQAADLVNNLAALRLGRVYWVRSSDTPATGTATQTARQPRTPVPGGGPGLYIVPPGGVLTATPSIGGVAAAFDRLTGLFSDPRNLNPADRTAAIVLTKSGSVGVNLAASDTVVFLQRLSGPGDEAQAEDRINRPQQDRQQTVYYLNPADPYGLVVFNRTEQKRDNLLSSFGESPTSDYSNPIVFDPSPGNIDYGAYTNTPGGVALLGLAFIEHDISGHTRAMIRQICTVYRARMARQAAQLAAQQAALQAAAAARPSVGAQLNADLAPILAALSAARAAGDSDEQEKQGERAAKKAEESGLVVRVKLYGTDGNEYSHAGQVRFRDGEVWISGRSTRKIPPENIIHIEYDPNIPQNNPRVALRKAAARSNSLPVPPNFNRLPRKEHTMSRYARNNMAVRVMVDGQEMSFDTPAEALAFMQMYRASMGGSAPAPAPAPAPRQSASRAAPAPAPAPAPSAPRSYDPPRNPNAPVSPRQAALIGKRVGGLKSYCPSLAARAKAAGHELTNHEVLTKMGLTAGRAHDVIQALNDAGITDYVTTDPDIQQQAIEILEAVGRVTCPR
jgi:hypothetical protein